MPISSSRSRWKFSFGRTPSSSSSSSGAAPPSPPTPPTPSSSSNIPMSFICPISSSLMFDPVIVPTGHTFERACIEACIQLGFTPPQLSIDPSSPSFLLIPNAALRDAIADFCDRASVPRPPPLSPQSARALVQDLIGSSAQPKKPGEGEEAAGAEAIGSKTLDQKNPSRSSPSSSASFSSSSASASSFSSSEMIATSTSSSSSSSSSSSLDESKAPKPPCEAEAPEEEASILTKLKSPQLSVRESGLRALRQSTRESSELRVSLCTPRLLQALVPMIGSKSPSTRTDSTAVIVNLSVEPPNKVKIVRSGAVLPLIEALKSSSSSSAEARDNAAGALFSLALDDENKLAIGVLGAIPPLVSMFASGNAEAGMALYHLSLAPNNLVKIAKMPGAVRAVLSTAAGAGGGGDGGRIGLMILASLARRGEGRVALMDAGAVKSMVAMVEEGVSGREEEHCLATMYEMSKGSLRFRALAKAAGAERALMGMLVEGEGGNEVAKEMARRTLKVVRGDEEEEVRSVVSDGLVSFRRRCDGFGGGSACNSASF